MKKIDHYKSIDSDDPMKILKKYIFRINIIKIKLKRNCLT